MASQDEIRDIRISKLKKLESLGINPYPITSRIDYTLVHVRNNFDTLCEQKEVSLCGRVMSLRGQGGLVFFDIFDGTDRFQCALKKDLNPTYTKSFQVGDTTEGIQTTLVDNTIDDAFTLFQDVVDIGDFVEVRGTLFITKRGEQTLQGASWRMLSKSLRALPEKWHGLQDTDERFRKRYLDTLMNEGVRDRFVIRTRTISLIRSFFDNKGYLEVETPILQTLAGGATAKPFVTHHNALDIDFNLTIAQELYLKKLLAGGFTRVYEIGRKFRNEGIDTTHNPEFTMLESQEAYADAKSQRQFIQDLIQYLVQSLFNATSFDYEGSRIETKDPFEVMPFLSLISSRLGIDDVRSLSREELVAHAHEHGVSVEPADAPEKIIDNIYKKVIRPNLIQPIFLINYPVEFNPFAKRREDDAGLIDRFQLVMGGLEVTNCFSELNNPIDQKLRYEEQDKKKREGEGEISPSDQEYLEAMEYGMPPNGGIGIGIDRLAMLFMNVSSIKEAILFPTLRPKEE